MLHSMFIYFDDDENFDIFMRFRQGGLGNTPSIFHCLFSTQVFYFIANTKTQNVLFVAQTECLHNYKHFHP